MRTKRKEKAITTLRVDQIRCDADTQARVKTDLDYIEELKLLVLDGHDLPPVDVWYDGKTFWCSDGFQRVEAYLRADRPTIECNVRPGTKADAVWAACAANQSHGLRRTNADKERAVKLALSHPKAAGMSDNAIAKHCGVSQAMVSKYHRGEETQNGFKSTKRVGLDGRTIDTANIGRKPAATPELKHATTIFVPDPENEQSADDQGVPWEADQAYEEPIYEDQDGPEEPVGDGPDGVGPAWEDQANAELAEAAGEAEGPEPEPVEEATADAVPPEDCPLDAGDTPAAADDSQTASRPAVTEATPEDRAKHTLKIWSDAIARWLGQSPSIDEYRNQWPGPHGDEVVSLATAFYEALKTWQREIKDGSCAVVASGPRLEPEAEAVRSELTGMMRQLSIMRSRLEKIANTRSGAFVEWLQIRKGLDDVHHALNFGRPYAVCPYCHGRGGNCKPCRGAGYINETVHHAIPKEQQVA